MSNLGHHAYLMLLVLSSSQECIQCHSSAMCEADHPKLADFSHQHLKAVPNGIPDHVTSLDLGYNNLSRIPDKVFQNLHSLMKLTLSNNHIALLDNNSFYGLKFLCYLDLSQNPLLQTSLPSHLFLPTPNLMILHMKHVPLSDCGTLPYECFKNLPNLRELYITSVNKFVLKSKFSSFPKLEKLDLSKSSIPHFDNTTFSALKDVPLRTLLLNSTSIQSLDIDTFGPLARLVSLVLSNNPLLGLPRALASLYGLQRRNMTDINLSKVNNRDAFGSFEHYIVDGNKTKFLANICVERLNLGLNYITMIKIGFFIRLKFPHCIKYLSISGHRINILDSSILGFSCLKNIEWIDAEGVQNRNNYQSNTLLMTRPIKSIIIPIPASMRHVNVGHVAQRWKPWSVKFLGERNLTFLDLSGNGLGGCALPVIGTVNLRTLKINQLDCSTLKPGLLASYHQLEVLEMAGMRLDLQTISDHNSHLLRFQRNLRTLNLMGNGIVDLHPNLFKSLQQLTSLNLTNNKLAQIPVTVRSCSTLKELDISYNVFTHIKKSDREFLETLNHVSPLTVRLDGNPLACSCETVEFIQWIIETHVTIVNRQNLNCVMTNGSRIFILRIHKELKDFRVKCVSRFWLTFSVITASLSIAAIFILVIVYRYRYNIKYWCLTKCQGNTAYDVIDGEDYQFDAFVAYNHIDIDWVCKNLLKFLEEKHQYKLCIHHRDFPAGEFIQQNIVNSVNSSRKTILVISRRFLECDWGEFEIEMAAMRMVQQGIHNVVIVILLEDIPIRQMPRCLLNMWNHITFLLWTDEPADVPTFLERLEQAMVR